MRSLLILSLFFGVISMVIPKDRRGNLVKWILLIVLLLSVGRAVGSGTWSVPEIRPETIPYSQESPEKIAFHNAISSRVTVITGSSPVSVESDLVYENDSCRLTFVRVVIREGNSEEVHYDLSKTFDFSGFTVLREEVGKRR